MSARSGPDYGLLGIRGIIGRFFRKFEDVLGGSWAPTVGFLVPSDQELETYRFAGMSSPLREWVGGRLLTALRIDGFTLRNKPFESTMSFAKMDLRRDKTGQLMVRVGDQASRAGQHWEALVTELITTNGLCYDGQNFFDTDHSLGDSGTQKNALAAAEVPALNVGTAAAPTEDEMADAIIGVISYMYTYKDDKGQPINGDAKRWAVMVPPNLIGPTQAAIRSKLRKSGSDNSVKHQDWDVVCIPNPRLTTTTVFYVFRLDCEMRAFVLQEEVAPEVEVLAAGSDEEFKNHRHLFGVFASRNAGYGEPLVAAKCTLS